MSDYLAIILIGGGSSYGRASDKETAIKNAITSLRDWDHLFVVANIETTINVYDVTGYSDCSWGNYGDKFLLGTNEATGAENEPIERKPEVVKRTTPKWKKR